MKKIEAKKNSKKNVTEVFRRIENAKNHDEKDNIFSHYNLQAIDREKVPKIEFTISPEEIEKLTSEGLLNLENDRYIFSSKLAEDSSERTTLEKLLYAIIWKQMDLGKEARIIDGIMGKELPERTYVFHQFGKFLNDHSEPIIDRNVLKCFKIYTGSENPDDYINWVKNIVEKGVFTATDIDEILLQLGRSLSK